MPLVLLVQNRQLGLAFPHTTLADIQPVDPREFLPLHGRRVAPAVVLEDHLDVLPTAEVHDEQRVVDVGTQQRGSSPAEVVRHDVRPHLAVLLGQFAGHVVQMPLDPARRVVDQRRLGPLQVSDGFGHRQDTLRRGCLAVLRALRVPDPDPRAGACRDHVLRLDIDDFLQVPGSTELSTFILLFSLLGCQVLPRDAELRFTVVLRFFQAFLFPYVKRSNPAALTPAKIERRDTDFTAPPVNPGFTQVLDLL